MALPIDANEDDSPSSSHYSWQRPDRPNVAHFDLFSGAAGDMMLAACLEAGIALYPDRPKNALLDRCVGRLKKGIPTIADEFEVSLERVWRGKGSLAAGYVNVRSIYHHRPAPVPLHRDHHHEDGAVQEKAEDSHYNSHEHKREHEYDHDSRSHSHGHGHRQSSSAPSASVKRTDDDPTRKGDPATTTHEHDHEHDHTHVTRVERSRALKGEHDNDTHSDGHQHNLASHHHEHDHQHHHVVSKGRSGPLRNFPQIRNLICHASDEYLPPWVKTTAVAAFRALAAAECHVHGAASIDQVHFHEVGAVDSIVDTVLTILALYELHCQAVTFSPMPLGYGTVQTAHGLLPVPAPATLYLMRNRPVVAGPPGWTGELVTPTAAALIHALSDERTTTTTTTTDVDHDDHCRPPKFILRAIGIGAGRKDFVNHPNILRLMIGEVSN